MLVQCGSLHVVAVDAKGHAELPLIGEGDVRVGSHLNPRFGCMAGTGAGLQAVRRDHNHTAAAADLGQPGSLLCNTLLGILESCAVSMLVCKHLTVEMCTQVRWGSSLDKT